MTTIIDILPKSLLSGSIQKIQNSFSSVAEPLLNRTFDRLFNFFFRPCETRSRIKTHKFALHEDCSSFCQILTSGIITRQKDLDVVKSLDQLSISKRNKNGNFSLSFKVYRALKNKALKRSHSYAFIDCSYYLLIIQFDYCIIKIKYRRAFVKSAKYRIVYIFLQ